MPRFAPLVKAGTKVQTARPYPKRACDLPIAGDRISCREWSGKPYRSKQRKLCEGVITKVARVRIAKAAAMVDGVLQWSGDFARADGFADYYDLADWFSATHGLPFEGILIQWTLMAEAPSMK